VCGIPANGCTSGFVDVDGLWSTGCECTDDGFGKSCASATGLGTIGEPGSTSKSGVLPLAGEENWFLVTFNGALGTGYHPHVSISSTGGDDIRFDVFNGASCFSGTLSCPGESNSAAANRTNWEVFWTNGDPNATVGLGCGASGGVDKNICNSCSCSSFGYNGMAAVGNGGSVYVRVHRVTGSPTCHSYTLSVSD
jgi:hypothetical protein